MKVRTIRTSSYRGGMACFFLLVLGLFAVGMNVASAAPGGAKGKPTPTATVSPSPTPSVTATVDPAAVALTCSKEDGYYIADYASGTDYSGAELRGAGLLLGVYSEGSHHLKFSSALLPSSPTTLSFVYDGNVLQMCVVNPSQPG